MTIEGRPELNVDWDKEYSKQRKNRLQDAVDDYLQDGKVSSLTFYNDLKDCLQDIISYHETAGGRAKSAMELIMGHRPVDLNPEEQWENFPNESGDYWTGGKE